MSLELDRVALSALVLIFIEDPLSPRLACVCRAWHAAISSPTFREYWRQRHGYVEVPNFIGLLSVGLPLQQPLVFDSLGLGEEVGLGGRVVPLHGFLCSRRSDERVIRCRLRGISLGRMLHHAAGMFFHPTMASELMVMRWAKRKLKEVFYFNGDEVMVDVLSSGDPSRWREITLSRAYANGRCSVRGSELGEIACISWKQAWNRPVEEPIERFQWIDNAGHWKKKRQRVYHKRENRWVPDARLPFCQTLDPEIVGAYSHRMALELYAEFREREVF